MRELVDAHNELITKVLAVSFIRHTVSRLTRFRQPCRSITVIHFLSHFHTQVGNTSPLIASQPVLTISFQSASVAQLYLIFALVLLIAKLPDITRQALAIATILSLIHQRRLTKSSFIVAVPSETLVRFGARITRQAVFGVFYGSTCGVVIRL